MIFLILKGRIGNQLFQYAVARALQEELGMDTKIVIDESEVLDMNWTNSLRNYSLPNVEYIQDRKMLKGKGWSNSYLMLCFYYSIIYKFDYTRKYKWEKLLQKLFNRLGLIAVENGYCQIKAYPNRNCIIYGFFQSERYFEKWREVIRKQYDIRGQLEELQYPSLEQLKERHSVCISIKVEDNVTEDMYHVCTKEYWEKAIDYINQNVDNPLFFVCSDNVEYVKENLIDCTKNDVVCQPKTFPVHISLAAMSVCEHFIIGNTTFGWWAQYLCDNPSKIVVAPKKWMNVDMPVDIYDNQYGWLLM